jgi:hypothetical protein
MENKIGKAVLWKLKNEIFSYSLGLLESENKEIQINKNLQFRI